MSNNSDSTFKSSRIRNLAILLTILLFPTLLYFFLATGKHNFISLPIYGEKEVVTKIVDGKEVIDTIYHTIPDFKFVNQNGDTITKKDLEGKIYVANYFFATCPTICPKMAVNLKYVQDRFLETPDVMIISHTVNPEHDSVPVLADYAKMVHANNQRWFFVTGNKEELYRLALEGYLLNASEDVLAPGGFLHSEQVVLVDKEGRIRGFYDGTSISEIKKNLIDDIKLLIADYMKPRKEKKK